MEEKWEIPYISVSFYGISEASESIRKICRFFGSEELIEKAELLIKREEEKARKLLSPYRNILIGKKAVLNTGGNKSWAFASALQDMGMEVVGVSIRKSNEADKAKLREILKSDVVLMKKPALEQMPLIEKTNADILLAGGRSLYAALKKGIPFIEVSQEKTGNYCSYTGIVNLAKDISSALQNPVFQLVMEKAPWERKVGKNYKLEQYSQTKVKSS